VLVCCFFFSKEFDIYHEQVSIHHRIFCDDSKVNKMKRLISVMDLVLVCVCVCVGVCVCVCVCVTGAHYIIFSGIFPIFCLAHAFVSKEGGH
jgi:hypothetical protein